MSEIGTFAAQVSTLALGAVFAVATLAVFFKWLPRLGPAQDGILQTRAVDVFEDGRYFDVLLSSGQRFAALRFDGMVNAEAEAGWALRGLAVMRRKDGRKVILRLENVRAFEEVVQAPAAPNAP